MAPLLDAGEVEGLLEQVGIVVSLGGASTYGRLRASAPEEGDPNQGPGFNARLVTILIATGSLPALQNGIVLTAGAETYRVHNHAPESEGNQTRIVAYPVSEAAADLWIAGTILLPWERREPGASSSGPFDRYLVAGTAVLVLEAGPAVAGTDPTLDFAILHCATAGGVYADSGFLVETIGAGGGARVLILGEPLEQFVKLLPAVAGEDDPAFPCGAAVLDVALPR
jgi:hypothetical protein